MISSAVLDRFDVLRVYPACGARVPSLVANRHGQLTGKVSTRSTDHDLQQ